MKKLCRLLYIAGIACIILCVVLSGCKKTGSTDTANTSPSPEIPPSTSPISIAPVQQSPTASPEVKMKSVGTVVNVSEGVNVRSGPSTESDILFTADLGTQFTVVKEYYTSEWHKIEYQNEEGSGVAYINANYLEVTQVPDTGTEPAKTAGQE